MNNIILVSNDLAELFAQAIPNWVVAAIADGEIRVEYTDSNIAASPLERGPGVVYPEGAWRSWQRLIIFHEAEASWVGVEHRAEMEYHFHLGEVEAIFTKRKRFVKEDVKAAFAWLFSDPA